MPIKKHKVAFRKFKLTYNRQASMYEHKECLQLVGGDSREGNYDIVYEENEEFKATFKFIKVKYNPQPLFIYRTLNGYLEAHMYLYDLVQMLKKGVDFNKPTGIWKYKQRMRNKKPTHSMFFVRRDEENDSN